MGRKKTVQRRFTERSNIPSFCFPQYPSRIKSEKTILEVTITVKITYKMEEMRANLF